VAQPGIVHHVWILGAIAAGFLVGVPLSLVPLTAVPQRTALSHAFGGLAAGLVGVAEYYLWLREPAHFTPFRTAALVIEVILGFLTFTGSLMAAGKLQEVKWIPQRPVTYPGQNFVNLGVLGAAGVLGVLLVLHPTAPSAQTIFPIIAGLALLFGVFLIIPSAAPTCRPSSRSSIPTPASPRWRWASCSTAACWWWQARSTARAA